MIIYRLSKPQFSDDLNGTGAKLFGARWNSRGVAMLYTSEHISLAMLEMLVHVDFREITHPITLIGISIPDADIAEVKHAKLKSRWQDDISYTQFMGDEFIRAKKHLVMKVPSAIVPEEYNYLVNPLHELSKKVRITATNDLQTDKRLFQF